MKILWIPHNAWRIPQRAHMFCRAFSENHEVHVTDWVADFSTLPDYFSRRYLNNFRYRVSRDGNITVHGIPRFSPALFFSPLRRLNSAIFSAHVARIIRRYSIDVVVGSFVVDPPQAPRLAFDISDDHVGYWRSYGRLRHYADEIEKVENEYLRRSDVVIASSHVLFEKLQPFAHGPTHFIPNGVDLQSYRNANGDLMRTRWNVQGRIVGMLGNHDKPADLDVVLGTAGILREENFTFIIAGRGDALPYARKRVRRETLPNVVFSGYVPLSDAAGIISAFDIGLCPYRKSSGANAGCPMRLLQYSAAGLPSVCTDLMETRRMSFPNAILVEDNPGSFAEGVRRAQTMTRSRPPQIEEYDLPRLTAQYEAILGT